MKYPSGHVICAGDAVYYQGDESKGIVTKVVESEDDIGILGLEGPGIFVLPDAFDEVDSSGVFIPESLFVEEGVVLTGE